VSDPVSWLVIEPGWEVVGADGGEIGTVESVVGDSAEDIFNGLAVITGMFDRPRYVPSEQVREITEGRVQLALSEDELNRLGEFEEPPASLELDGTEASVVDRVADVFTDPQTGSQPLTPWRRFVNWIFRRG
jgi:hypothetical protein